MGNNTGTMMKIKHGRIERGFFLEDTGGLRAGSIICSTAAGGMDVFVTDVQHDIWFVIESRKEAADVISILGPVGPVKGHVGKFKLVGKLAHSTSMLGNKLVFQPVGNDDVFVAVGSALSRSVSVRRGGKEIASIVKGSRVVEIAMSLLLEKEDEAIVVGIAIATCLLQELKTTLVKDIALPTIIAS